MYKLNLKKGNSFRINVQYSNMMALVFFEQKLISYNYHVTSFNPSLLVSEMQ